MGGELGFFLYPSENEAGEVKLTAVVLDTAIIIKWFKKKDEEFLSEAAALKSDYLNGLLRVAEPDLFLYETGNVLCLKTKLNELQVKERLRNILDLGFEIFSPSAELLGMTSRMALDFGITFYDATFLGLAHLLSYDFITADKKFYNRVKSLSFSHFLGDINKM